MARQKTFTRREAIKLGGLTALALASGGCAKTVADYGVSRPGIKFNPVLVSADRVIREVTGLRPYRTSGFVVSYARIGNKDVVHNYGHGGAGISLCWGTSQLAMEKALKLPHRECAVIGCGVVGLATATLMQREGYNVTIYAKDLPPETTSNIAAGKWTPRPVFDRDLITPEFYRDFLKATRLSYRYYQNFVGSQYGVRWIQNYVFGDEPIEFSSSFYDLIDTYRDLRNVPRSEYPFNERHCMTYTTLQVDTPVFLNSLMRDFRIAGGRIVVLEFNDINQLQELNEPLVMNCTGLGSYSLFEDKELVPVKGQLTALIPQPEVNYTTAIRGQGLYMAPRKDGIILGGSWEEGEWNLAPDTAQSRRILEGHAEFFGAEDRLSV